MSSELRTRIYHSYPQCICGEPLTSIRPKRALCDECGRLYSRLYSRRGLTMMANNTILETVRVVFNGDITVKTFTWEM